MLELNIPTRLFTVKKHLFNRVLEVVVLDEVGTSDEKFRSWTPLPVVDGVPLVNHKVLWLTIVGAVSIQALNNILVIFVDIVGLRSEPRREIFFRKVRQILGMEVAVGSPRTGHVDAK